jgi:hypothetical protein
MNNMNRYSNYCSGSNRECAKRYRDNSDLSSNNKKSKLYTAESSMFGGDGLQYTSSTYNLKLPDYNNLKSYIKNNICKKMKSFYFVKIYLVISLINLLILTLVMIAHYLLIYFSMH